MGDHSGLSPEREGRPAELSGLAICQLPGDSDKDTLTGQQWLEVPFEDHRTAALALLNGDHRLTRKAGSFLGQCTVDPQPLSSAQREWIDTLLIRAGLPPLGEAEHG